MPCGRVDGDKGQQLHVSLTGSGLSGAIADFMELDIEAKGDVIVVADLYLRGDLVASGYELLTGTRSDSGPDSADGDNYRFRVPPAPGTSAVRCVRASREEQRRFFLARGRGRRHDRRARRAR